MAEKKEYLNTPTDLGYTSRTIAADAVIRHQEDIIESLSKQLSDDEHGHYYTYRGLFGFKLKKPQLTLVGQHVKLIITQFERGLVSLRKELAEYVREDIGT
jgi:hypothetical protein